MYAVDLSLEVLGMTSTGDDIPGLPQHIKGWSSAKKKAWLDKFVEDIVVKIYVPFTPPSMDNIQFKLVCGNEMFALDLPAHKRGQTMNINLGGRSFLGK